MTKLLVVRNQLDNWLPLAPPVSMSNLGWVEFGDPREWWVAQLCVNQNQQFFIGDTENVTHHFINGLLHPPYDY